MKFNKKDNWCKENNPYNWKKGCEFCKGKFEEDEKFIRIDVQNGNFRGDDSVYCFHNNCYENGIRKLVNN